MAHGARVLGVTPRLPFGSNCAAHWGLLYDAFGKERITIYGLDDRYRGIHNERRVVFMNESDIAARGLERGTLEPLLRDFPLEEGALHAVMPPGRATTARVRALIDYLVGRFGPEPQWDPCWLAGDRR